METTEETKVEAFYKWISDIYGTRCIGMSCKGVITRNYRSNPDLQFTSSNSTRFRDLFKYTFTAESPVVKRKKGYKYVEEHLPKEATYSRALSAIVDFFDLAKKYKTLFDPNIEGEELKDWGKILYDCCIFVVDVFFDGNDKLDHELKELYKEKVIQKLASKEVLTTEDSELAAEDTMSQHDSPSTSGTADAPLSEMNEYELLDLTPAQMAKVSRQIRKAIPIPEPEDFLNQPQHSLPHRNPSMKYDEREHYTYEELNEDVDHIIKVLSELPDDLDDVQKCSLYSMVDELCGYRKYYLYNLSLEKKQQTLSTLESTADRFFEDVIGQPLPPKSSVSPEKWQACFDKGRSSAALEMCITALRRYINNETNKKTD